MEDAASCYIGRVVDRPWVWGETDCTSWLAGWVAERTGVDVGASLRSRGRSRRSAARIVSDAGGLASLCDGLMREAGCRQTRWPQDGDVGVIRIKIGRRLRSMAALRADEKWVIRVQDGILAVPVSALVAWRMPWAEREE